MDNERLQVPNKTRFLGFTSRVVGLVGKNGLIERHDQRKEYKKRRSDFVNSPFSPQVRPELFKPDQPDPNIIEGEFRVIETNQPLEPQSPGQE